MKERFDWLKNIGFEAGGREVHPDAEAHPSETMKGVAPDEEKKKRNPLADREAWIEKWMEDIRQFIRNIDVNSL